MHVLLAGIGREHADRLGRRAAVDCDSAHWRNFRLLLQEKAMAARAGDEFQVEPPNRRSAFFLDKIGLYL